MFRSVREDSDVEITGTAVVGGIVGLIVGWGDFVMAELVVTSH